MVAVLCLIVLARLLKKKRARQWYKDPHFLFLFIPISFAQQFLFQGFLLYKLELIFAVPVAIFINALIFGYMHTIYPNPIFSGALGVGAGLFFGVLYTFFPNIIVSSVVHAILNFVAVYFSFFTFLTKEKRPKRTSFQFS